MGDNAKPAGPRSADFVSMIGQLRRGSAADAPLGIFPALREFARTPRGAPGSVLNLKDVERSATHRDLSTAKLRSGEEAFDFELPRLDLDGGREIRTGETARLSAYRHVSPVALIFGSYT
jgi:hypothetical protein